MGYINLYPYESSKNMKIKLIQSFNGNDVGDIIEVTNKIGNDLINQKIATNTKTKDYLVKTKMGKTKAFNKSPNI